ncbi:hypothetical protein HAX54_047685 [Datura stramonium]|uniref:Uncharacterized protein n=1 Tax=Datura stramonium TaxID=4076 RepID=A0ABS8ST76_DATST|nr:hypothetical protein [Datura stramonium]
MLNIVHENSTNELNQLQEELIKELRELKMELVKVNKNQEALEKKIEAQFVEMKQYIVDSNIKLVKDIKELLGKGDSKGSLPTDQVSEKPTMAKFPLQRDLYSDQRFAIAVAEETVCSATARLWSA